MKLYFDEDSSEHRLVSALRTLSIDVLASFEAKMNARDDDSQLNFSTAQGRILVSANARDFAFLHQQWFKQGRPHAGILLIPQQRYSTGEIVRRVVRFSAAIRNSNNSLYYLSNF